MADIFREVDEELQQERAASLWRRYGGWVIAAAVAIVLGVAGTVLWRDYEASTRADQAAAYEAAASLLEDGRAREAANAFAALAEDGADGYAAISRLRQASALVDADDVAGAVDIYMALAADGSVPAPYGDLARLHGVRLQIGTADTTALNTALAPLLADDNPWYPLARETEAAIALAAGDRAAALEIFKALADDAATPGRLRQRASEAVAALEAGG